MEREIWKDIIGYNGLYQVSNFGRVKSLSRRTSDGRNIKEKIISTKNSKGWYLTFKAANDRVYKTLSIHKLVAVHFIPNIKNKPEINHIDGNKQNNFVENLEWVTPSENMEHAVKLKPSFLKEMKRKNQFIKPKRVQQIDFDGNFIAEYANSVIASNLTGICSRNILQVANKTEFSNGKIRKQAGGFIWKFKE